MTVRWWWFFAATIRRRLRVLQQLKRKVSNWTIDRLFLCGVVLCFQTARLQPATCIFGRMTGIFPVLLVNLCFLQNWSPASGAQGLKLKNLYVLVLRLQNWSWHQGHSCASGPDCAMSSGEADFVHTVLKVYSSAGILEGLSPALLWRERERIKSEKKGKDIYLFVCSVFAECPQMLKAYYFIRDNL